MIFDPVHIITLEGFSGLAAKDVVKIIRDSLVGGSPFLFLESNLFTAFLSFKFLSFL